MTRAWILLLAVACSQPPAPGPWLTDEAAGFARAREQHRAVLLDLTATWSMPSLEVSRRLDQLRPEIDRDFVAVRIDVSDAGPRAEELRARYHAETLPAVLLVDVDGTLLDQIVDNADQTALAAKLAAAAGRRTR